MSEGWKCPVCGKVWGPHVDGCRECNGQVEYKWNYPVVIPYVPTYPTYPWYPPPVTFCGTTSDTAVTTDRGIRYHATI